MIVYFLFHFLYFLILTPDKVKPEIIEKGIEPLQKQKEKLEVNSKDLAEISEIINVKVEDFTSDAIKDL